MICLTPSFRALIWRNAIYRKRRWIASLIELILPALCIVVLYLIKYDLESDPNSSLRSVVVEAKYPTADDVIIPFSFSDYVTALQAKRVCLSNPSPIFLQVLFGLPEYVISGIQSSEWPVPFVFCNSLNCRSVGEDATKYCTYKTLGLTTMNPGTSGGDNSGYERMHRFKTYVETKYNQLTNKSLLPFDYDFLQIFDSNEELQSYVTSENYGEWVNGKYLPKVAIAIVFVDGKDYKTYDYTIRVNSTNFNSEEQALEAQQAVKTTPPTNRLFDPYNHDDANSCAGSSSGGPNLGQYGKSCTGQYLLNGAVTLQRLVDDWILDDSGVTSITVARNGAVFLPFPEKEYVSSGFYQNIAPFAPLLFTLGLLYPISATIRSIVLEKELRQKELMKMMSASECDIGWSWFVSFYSFFSISGILCAVCTNLLYPSSSFALLLIFWQLTFIACIVYCILVAAMSSKATLATLIGIMLFLVGYFLPLVVNYQTGRSALIALLSLHPVTAYTYGLIMIGYLEDSGVGVQLTTITSSDFPSGYTFAASLGMLLLDSILWGVVTWYLNRILVGDFGTALSWNFPLTRQYWCPRKSFEDGASESSDIGNENTRIPLEPISETMKSHQHQTNNNVHIHNLCKKFGEKTAVDNLNLSLYSGQITCLLGHNGAGKTTVIGMLTGMIAPTSGNAVVAGYDIRTDLPLLRQHVGVCLQHDCLFPQLTVKEHIQFFLRVKGLNLTTSREEFEQSVRVAVEDVALSEKRQTLSKELSGGMKRKLSVAIAFCGNPTMVFLDEPTSGMDPFSRRFTWNVIRQYRENRCIILTTHFMDEADLLGDRIAIMSDGQLRCAGSPLFLKKHYGVGYQLTIIKKGDQNHVLHAAPDVGGSDEFCEEMITQLDDDLDNIVKGAVPSASLLSNSGKEIRFQLPMRESKCFISMFKDLDNLMTHCVIDSYGVSVTTLDDVFLTIARGEEGLHLSQADLLADEGPTRMERLAVTQNEDKFRRHVQALFAKRAKSFKRDKKAWFCSTILPTVIALLGFIVVKFMANRHPNYPSLTLSLDQNNPYVKADRNPIPFNKPGLYQCQPGKCIYNPTFVDDISYCGSNAKLSNDSELCSIQDSSSIVDQISQYGAFGVDSEVSDVDDTSLSVYESSAVFEASQYGGLFFTHDAESVLLSSANGSSYNSAVVQSCQNNTGNYSTAELCNDFAGIGYIVNYNFTSLHSSLLYQSIADEALIRDSLNDANYKILASIWPLPITKLEESYNLAQDSFSAWFLIVLSFPFISGSFVTFVVAERESKAKHLQTVAGVNANAYWLSTYAWDIANYQLPQWSVIALMYLLDVEAFITNERQVVSGTFALIILFGPASAGFAYIVSFLFRSPSFCNLFVIVFNFFIGMVGPIICLILRLLAVDPSKPKPHLRAAAIAVEWTLRLVPSFCLGRGLLFIINIGFFEFIEGKRLTVWSPTIALYDVLFLGIETILYILATIEIDVLSSNPKAVNAFQSITKCFCLAKKNKLAYSNTNERDRHKDIDVISEANRVLGRSSDNDLIVLKELTKVYPNGKLAVDHLSLGIPYGQCFGLLGVNGAGKTTLMSILTAEFPPSSGDALLSGYSARDEPEQTRCKIGYCPQFDAHFMNMTGSEHVELYAVIKGVPRDMLGNVVATKLKEVGLDDFDAKRVSSEYSGGMKRKLSVACATIGHPQIVFLDEPSTGMDPVSRRELWKVITRMVQGSSDMLESEKTSVILTTHSMEECEGGKLRCIGSAQHLKNRFGRGYQIEMKIKHASTDDADVHSTTSRILNCLHELNGTTTLGAEETDMMALASDICINLSEVKSICQVISGDDYLIKMICPENPLGFPVYKLAISSLGVTVNELSAFCVEELRMRSLVNFFESSYSSAILRERQDVRVRFEISSVGLLISSVFTKIEEHKDELVIEDYGVSQTSLEQVFNLHAAVAEEEKKNTVDGVQT